MKSYGFPLLALAFGLMLGLAGPARAQPGDFMEWLAGLKRDAAAQGVSAATLDTALTGVQPLPRVLELDRKQPEGTRRR